MAWSWSFVGYATNYQTQKIENWSTYVTVNVIASGQGNNWKPLLTNRYVSEISMDKKIYMSRLFILAKNEDFFLISEKNYFPLTLLH